MDSSAYMDKYKRRHTIANTANGELFILKELSRRRKMSEASILIYIIQYTSLTYGYGDSKTCKKVAARTHN